MTNAPVVTITDELIAEINERVCGWKHMDHMVIKLLDIAALLAHIATLEQLAADSRKDAERWRYARDILSVEAIEYAYSDFINFGLPAAESESIRADAAIDAVILAAGRLEK